MTSRPKRDPDRQVVNLASSDGLDLNIHALAGRVAWKFVIIQTANTLDMVVGPVARFRYHAGLVRQFCSDRSIPALYSRESGRVEVYDQLVRVLGGGHFRIDPQARSVRFWGQSTAYGPYESDTVRKVAGTNAFFEGFTIMVEQS